MARIQKLYHCLRLLVMVLCGILFLSGFAFLVFGGWVKFDSIYNVKVMGLFYEYLDHLAYIYMGMGVLLCLVGLTGFCAAKKENWCLITLFFFTVTVLFCTKVVGIVFFLGYRDMGVKMVREMSKKSLQTAYMGPAATDPVSTYECCGFENSIVDFEKSVFSTTTGLKYPKICCVDKNSNKCNGTNTAEGLVYPESCFGKLMGGIEEKFTVIGGTVIGICVVELLAMMISMVLFVKRSDEEHYKNHCVLPI
ncbi:tetraspanin-16-like [Scleropages formosus]|uniref:tetraspanin-16-like n=1 Tax=Scleropages formosus TaxID=113540 RepID=UPI0010FAAC2F|nr:tetraspanin-16-like [Scleropages formosus]